METKEHKNLEMKAHEAFIRRASRVNLPFMLKGSYVTRQYFQNPNDRIPADLDWVYMDIIKDEATATQKFNEWATLVTEFELEDDVKFRSFKENEFWRRIDYAMIDDFPTVNTDLQCFIGKEKVDFGLDISFNLDIEQPPVPLIYQPLEGEVFLIPNTAPISLQVSWKIHQTLVRPRFKDLFDLMYLVQHPTFDENNLKNTLQALINECSADKVDLIKLKYFLNFELEKLFSHNSINEVWLVWRHNQDVFTYHDYINYERGYFSTDVSKLPTKLNDFLNQFEVFLKEAGFGIYLFGNLPKPSRNKREVS
jgi:Nucleotidyl transferase AbiEii toxin, Type IV TA system